MQPRCRYHGLSVLWAQSLRLFGLESFGPLVVGPMYRDGRDLRRKEHWADLPEQSPLTKPPSASTQISISGRIEFSGADEKAITDSGPLNVMTERQRRI
jgi:hypothetical protein